MSRVSLLKALNHSTGVGIGGIGVGDAVGDVVGVDDDVGAIVLVGSGVGCGWVGGGVGGTSS